MCYCSSLTGGVVVLGTVVVDGGMNSVVVAMVSGVGVGEPVGPERRS